MAQGLVCLWQRTQMWTMPRLAPSAKGTQPCCSTLCVLRCLHILPNRELSCLYLQVARIALLWAVLFLALRTEEPHTYKTNKEFVRAKETLCEPKATRCSPSITAPESARTFPVMVYEDGIDTAYIRDRERS